MPHQYTQTGPDRYNICDVGLPACWCGVVSCVFLTVGCSMAFPFSVQHTDRSRHMSRTFTRQTCSDVLTTFGPECIRSAGRVHRNVLLFHPLVAPMCTQKLQMPRMTLDHTQASLILDMYLSISKIRDHRIKLV